MKAASGLPRAGDRVTWFWKLTGPYVRESMRLGDGEVESLDRAKVTGPAGKRMSLLSSIIFASFIRAV
jgi:hypothetical protein